MSDYYCPNCGADLEDQLGFDPNVSYWTCTNCGTLLTNPGDPDMDTTSGATWFCDCCGACLNKQYGFDDSYSSWTCTECGHVNNLSEDNIYSSEEEYENSITHYHCPNCGAELNRQSSFYEEDEYTCESCGSDLYKDGDEYEIRYTCPHCGDTLNSQWLFNSYYDDYTCANCGSKLHRSYDEYEEIEEAEDEEETSDEYEEDESNDHDEYSSFSDAEEASSSEDTEDFSRYYKSTFKAKPEEGESYSAEKAEKQEDRKSKKENRRNRRKRFWRTVTRKRQIIGVSSNQCVGMNYEELVKRLQQKEFYKISVNFIEDLPLEKKDKENSVKRISINNVAVFSADTQFPYNAKIQIIYHKLQCKPIPFTSRKAKKQQANDIINQLHGLGFANVFSSPIPDLITGWIVKDGSVESVIIDGSANYKKDDMFRLDANIVVNYHTFNKSK